MLLWVIINSGSRFFIAISWTSSVIEYRCNYLSFTKGWYINMKVFQILRGSFCCLMSWMVWFRKKGVCKCFCSKQMKNTIAEGPLPSYTVSMSYKTADGHILEGLPKLLESWWGFLWVDGDSYASRGMNKLSLLRATYQALPGPVLSDILLLGFSLGLMALHLITFFLSSILCQCFISILLISQPGHHLSIPYLLVFLLQQIFTESIKGTLAKVGSYSI